MTNTYEGIINYIGEIKSFGKGRSLGIKLENDPEGLYHNIFEFSEAEVNKIKGNIKAGDKVKLLEEPNYDGSRMNVKKIEILSSMVTSTGTESSSQTTIPKSLNPMVKSIGIDEELFEKCVSLVNKAVERTRTMITEQDMGNGFNPNNIIENIVSLYLGFE